MQDNKMVLDYFFNTDKKPILAFIVVTKNNDIHLLLQKTGSISSQWRLGLTTSKRILNNAYGGVFNNGSSKIAVFSDNRIQVYAINLYRNKQQKTTSILTTPSSELANPSSTTNTSYLPINEEQNNNVKTKQNANIQKNIFFYISIATVSILSIVIITTVVKIAKRNKRKKQIIKKLLTGEVSILKYNKN